ncbi:MAG: cyclic nucleotide-binding domain-containing protein [Pseudorhodoplanes sp.]
MPALKTGIDFELLSRYGGKPVFFEKGDVIFREGDPGDCLYVIREGAVDITLGNRVLKLMEPGEIFGEMSLIDGEPRSANAVARAETTVIPITEEQFLFLIGKLPYFAVKVMRVLAVRLRDMNRAI